MTAFLSGRLRQMKPYVPGEQPRDQAYIKLNTNESPYPPSEGVLKAVEAEAGKMNLYSDPELLIARRKLAEMGFRVLDSRANFLFAAPSRLTGGEYYRRLREKGVLVRHFSKERIAPFVRISIGSPEQMRALIDRTREIIREVEG